MKRQVQTPIHVPKPVFQAVFCVFLLWLAACGPPPAPPDEAAAGLETEAAVGAEPTESPEEGESLEEGGRAAAETPVPTAGVEPTPAATRDDTPIGDAEAEELMVTLLRFDTTLVRDALGRITAARDERFIPVFIELMRANQIGLVPVPQEVSAVALEQLSGESFGRNWPAWVEWYGGTELQPPPGFTTWKGQLLSQIDPEFADFLKDEYPATIRTEEIQWGGVVVDGIPALDQPAMLPAGAADYLEDEYAVFGLEINGDARAYPLLIMDWHEMANDTVGGVPVSIAYCTLCGAAIAYDGRASDGNVYDFGSSGFLFRSNKLMYDRQTRTLWNQLTGEPVLGELVGRGVALDILPIVLTTWGEWRAQHPDTLVLDVETGYDRPYSPGAAYADYFAATETMFPVWQRSDLLAAKDQVYALRVDGVPKAYPLRTLAAEQVVNDELGETNLVLVATRGLVNVSGQSARTGRERAYPAGSEVRVYARGERVFSPGPDADTLVDAAGREWQVTEEALIGPDGETAARVSGHLAYWFGWYAFFPNTLVYGQE